jgi:hypothetical protein
MYHRSEKPATNGLNNGVALTSIIKYFFFSYIL